MIAPGRIKIVPPFQQTYGNVNGSSVPVYKIFFTIDDKGSYSVLVPRDGFTIDAGMAAINQVAEGIIGLQDAFK